MSNVFFAHTASHYRLTPLPCGFVSLAIISRYSAKRSQFGHFQVCGKFSLSQPTHLHPRWWMHIAQFNYTGSWGNTSMQPDFSYQQRYSHHFHPSLGDANAWLTQPLSQLSTPLSMGDACLYPPSPGDAGLFPPSPGDAGLFPPSPGDAGFIPPSPGDAGLFPPSKGDACLYPPS